MTLPCSRRRFLGISAASGAAALAGCATNPVSGRKQFMLISESREMELDRKWAPHQFSSDYGAMRDSGLNSYITEVGKSMSVHTQRRHMPYSFRVVNSVVVNGYTLPAGSIALARGLMLSFRDEAELAAVLGHELAHVNWRHAGERMSKSTVAALAAAGLGAYAKREMDRYADLAAGLGSIGANLMLSRYSRDDEREADASGMDYMVAAGHNPNGMVGVMQTFMSLHKTRPSTVDLLFSTHPMSDERYRNAQAGIRARHSGATAHPVNRERFMDRTAALRKLRGPIESMQKGQKEMLAGKPEHAAGHFAAALRDAPTDYAGLLLAAKCSIARKKYDEAVRYTERARAAYPGEPQADHVAGMAKMKKGQYNSALADFAGYERKLPGNPNTIFFRGRCLESMGRKEQAAAEYKRYYRRAPSGQFAGHVQNRLVSWGHMRPPEPTGR